MLSSHANTYHPIVILIDLIFGVLISVISWRPVLVVEEAGALGENHRPWASNWSTLPLALRVKCTFFLQSRARTHVVLVIGLYELLGNPTTELIEPPRPSQL